MSGNSSKDPLVLLPPEIVLRILDFAPVSTVAALTRTSKPWRAFIDEAHQDHIYSNAAKTDHGPQAAGDASQYYRHTQTFSKYYEGTQSWKELCRKQTLLRRNWNSAGAITTESIFNICREPVWRFRPDFKRRFIVSTSQFGGLEVTCMDTARRLWSLGHHEVRPYAHLEYDEVDGRGMAVWDREGDAVEVWRTTEEDGGDRGTFEKVGILEHDCETRGYQLSFNTLCVVSSQGQGFVYDMLQKPPQLTTHLKIKRNAIGHLYQDQDYVLYSIGTKGYHAYSKATGQFVGSIEPWKCSVEQFYHIRHPVSQELGQDSLALASALRSMQGASVFPPSCPNDGRLLPIRIVQGPKRPIGQGIDQAAEEQHTALQDDDWGAGMLSGDMMVGVSRGGRVIIVRNWRECLAHADGNNEAKAAAALKRNASLVLCTPPDDPRNFDLGGWLSIRGNRILFEVRDLVYVLTLEYAADDDGGALLPTGVITPSYAICKSATSSLGSAVPVSFMALYDDCVMYTYTVLGIHEAPVDEQQQRANPYSRLFLTKAVRMLCFAPPGVGGGGDGGDDNDSEEDDGSNAAPDPGDETPEDAELFLSAFFRQLVSSAVREAAETDAADSADEET